MRRKKLKRKIMHMLQEGKTINQICTELKTTNGTVSKILKESGIHIVQGRFPKSIPRELASRNIRISMEREVRI